jgi:hypothetical protein
MTNMKTNEGSLRPPTELEMKLFDRLLVADFPGKVELARLLENVLVRTIDDDGGLRIEAQAEGRAPVAQRVPVEGEARDEDGVKIHAMLHVVEGRPMELEFFREDGSTIRKMPPADSFELIVLPTAPKDGWLYRR